MIQRRNVTRVNYGELSGSDFEEEEEEEYGEDSKRRSRKKQTDANKKTSKGKDRQQVDVDDDWGL